MPLPAHRGWAWSWPAALGGHRQTDKKPERLLHESFPPWHTVNQCSENTEDKTPRCVCLQKRLGRILKLRQFKRKLIQRRTKPQSSASQAARGVLLGPSLLGPGKAFVLHQLSQPQSPVGHKEMTSQTGFPASAAGGAETSGTTPIRASPPTSQQIP